MKESIQNNQDQENRQENQSSAPSEVQPEPTGQENTQEPKDQMKKIQDELTEAKDKYLRLYAEFDNHRRRTAREKIDLIQTANEQLIKELLPVADDFERAGKAFRDRNDKESEGFFLIQNKFMKILESSGVKDMDTLPASEFNPDLHDAITQTPALNENLKGKIVDVVEKGYLLNEKVLRHAKVVVGK